MLVFEKETAAPRRRMLSSCEESRSGNSKAEASCVLEAEVLAQPLLSVGEQIDLFDFVQGKIVIGIQNHSRRFFHRRRVSNASSRSLVHGDEVVGMFAVKIGLRVGFP